MIRVLGFFKLPKFLHDISIYLALALSCLLFALLFKRVLLILPRLSVEKKGFVVHKGKLINATQGITWPLILFFFLLLPSLLPGLATLALILFQPYLKPFFSEMILFALYFVYFMISIAYSSLILATLLSLYYRDKVRPQLLDNQ